MARSVKQILFDVLEELEMTDLKKFKSLLEDYPLPEGYSKIPRGRIKEAGYIDIAEQMILFYNEEYALEITADLLRQINRRDLLEGFQKLSVTYLDKNEKQCKNRIQDHRKNYTEDIMEEFRVMEERNSRLGEYVSFTKRYTQLLIIKNHRDQQEREHEITYSGRKHAELMDERAECSYSSIDSLFDPDEDGHSPRTIVLQGGAGIGKTMTAHKIMLDWASGELFQDKFDFVFYIQCRECNQRPCPASIADLLLQSHPGVALPISEILADPNRLLFIIDGFDELSISVGPTVSGGCSEAHIENIFIRLIRKKILPKCFLIITTRPTALEKLGQYLKMPRFAEILGFSEEDRKEYFNKFFGNTPQGTQAFNIVKDNDILFTMCFVPIVCWIVCTAIKQQMQNPEDLTHVSQTTTSVYLSFLSNLIKQHPGNLTQPMLKKLCALAKEGVYKKKILFEEEDITRYGLAAPDIQSLFFKNDLFLKDTDCYNYYSFIHLSFQEFFTALYYILREAEESREDAEFHQKDAIGLLETYRTCKNDDLMLPVRFLFGLFNNERQLQMEKILNWTISSGLKSDIQKWITEELMHVSGQIGSYQMDLLHCLYEVQDEEFVKSAIGHWKDFQFGEALERRMTTMDFKVLLFCLKNCTEVQKLHIYNYQMGPEDHKALAPWLLKCSSLKMECCRITNLGFEDLSHVIKANQSLTELDLSSNSLWRSGMEKLCEALKHSNCNLQKLVVQNCRLDESCCLGISSVFSTNVSLTQLDLSINALEDAGIRLLCKGLQHPACKIQKLVLTCCFFTCWCCRDISSVLSTSHSLTELDLGSNEVGDYGVKQLCEGLKLPGCKMQKLLLWDCSLTDACCADLSSVLCTNQSLTQLLMGGNQLGDSGVRLLCEGLKYPSCKLQKLWLPECSLTSACCGDIASVLSTNQYLKVFCLNGNALGDSGVRQLCEGLKHEDCKIQSLWLNETKLTDDCVEELCSAVRVSRSLQTLCLMKNLFTDRSIASFIQLKQTCKNLTRLKLQKNKFSPEGIKELRSVLEAVKKDEEPRDTQDK